MYRYRERQNRTRAWAPICTCPEQPSTTNKMKYDQLHCDIHNSIGEPNIETTGDKINTYQLRYIPPRLENKPSGVNFEKELRGSLERTPISTQEERRSKKNGKKNGKKKGDEEEEKFVDAYGNEVLTDYQWQEGEDNYDPRWPGVIVHVHEGLFVGSGESKWAVLAVVE